MEKNNPQMQNLVKHAGQCTTQENDTELTGTSPTLELEPDFELNEEITRTGVLASFFEGKGVPRNRLKDILSGIWKLKGNWRIRTRRKGVWRILFDHEEDNVNIMENRTWIINGKLLIIHEWPEDGEWYNVDMSKAVFGSKIQDCRHLT
uniref:DUF4283 domain-containing protein n=1 Tax=Cannabis sativa TaxID=3483 RepID=A0A803PAB2_CANSA